MIIRLKLLLFWKTSQWVWKAGLALLDQHPDVRVSRAHPWVTWASAVAAVWRLLHEHVVLVAALGTGLWIPDSDIAAEPRAWVLPATGEQWMDHGQSGDCLHPLLCWRTGSFFLWDTVLCYQMTHIPLYHITNVNVTIAEKWGEKLMYISFYCHSNWFQRIGIYEEQETMRSDLIGIVLFNS